MPAEGRARSGICGVKCGWPLGRLSVMLSKMLDSVRMLWRFSVGLKPFLGSTLSGEQCRQIVVESMRDRAASFLELLRRAVYDNPRSPYLALLRWAGVEFGDVAGMVRQEGIEATLQKLYDAGVFVRLEEFKGLRPIERLGLELRVRAADFNNPLLRRDFIAASSGSTGRRQRLAIDLDLLVIEAAYNWVVEQAHGVLTRPRAIWWPIPPGSAGLKHALRAVKCGRMLDKWFSPTKISWHPREFPSAAFLCLALCLSRFWKTPIPIPEFTPLEQAWRIAVWLGEQTGHGSPAYLSAPASSIVRICQAALQTGVDISGSLFRVSGEPYTEAKRRVVVSCGAQTFSSWSLSECGTIAGGCFRAQAIDEVHLYSGKLALIQRPVSLKHDVGTVDAFHLTTLRRETPKVLLNVDTGDYGIVSERRCGCPLDELGMTIHVHTIRNYEKLTTSGMHILGSDILELVENLLPQRHGGKPGDYQFVEEAGSPETCVTIVVSRSVKNLKEEVLLRDVKQFLSKKSRAQRMMLNIWEQGKSIRVVRAEPYTTYTGKTPALRIVTGSLDSEGLR